MPVATLRTISGSAVTAIPTSLLAWVQLPADSQDNSDMQQRQLGRTIVKKSCYALAELLAQCDATIPLNVDEREWLEAPDAEGT